MAGTLSLDIDGTMTKGLAPLRPELVQLLESLQKEGWSLIFNTGRCYSFSMKVLDVISCPFFCAVENGASLIEGQTGRLLIKKYLSKKQLSSLLDDYAKEHSINFVIYGGVEQGDACAYCPAYITEEQKAFTAFLEETRLIHIHPLSSFLEIPWEFFPAVKAFGTGEEVANFAKDFSLPSLKALAVLDPFAEERGVGLLNLEGVDKGFVLREFFSQKLGKGPLIVAGDDVHDLPMFEEADCAIAMDEAKEAIKSKADLIAEDPLKGGLERAIIQAIERVT